MSSKTKTKPKTKPGARVKTAKKAPVNAKSASVSAPASKPKSPKPASTPAAAGKASPATTAAPTLARASTSFEWKPSLMFNIQRAAQIVHQLFSDALKDNVKHITPTQFTLLTAIAQAESAKCKLNLTQLRLITGIDRSTLSDCARRMASAGRSTPPLVTLVRDTIDTRQLHIALTQAGRNVIRDAQSAADHANAELKRCSFTNYVTSFLNDVIRTYSTPVEFINEANRDTPDPIPSPSTEDTEARNHEQPDARTLSDIDDAC